MKQSHTGGGALFLITAIIYGGLLILFGWQTWMFVSWLFPDDQLLMKCLTMLCFDVMALIWAVIDLFYKHATRGTRQIVRWGWGISFLLSLLASILYLVLQSYTRFAMQPSQDMVNIGYAITIVALTITVLLVTFWLYTEWSVRHPHTDDYLFEQLPTASVPSTRLAVPPVAQTPGSGIFDGLKQMFIRRDTSVPVAPSAQPAPLPDTQPLPTASLPLLNDLLTLYEKSGQRNTMSFSTFVAQMVPLLPHLASGTLSSDDPKQSAPLNSQADQES